MRDRKKKQSTSGIFNTRIPRIKWLPGIRDFPGESAVFFLHRVTLLKKPQGSGILTAIVSEQEVMGEHITGRIPGYSNGIPAASGGIFQDIVEIDLPAQRSSTGGSGSIVSGLDSLLKAGESGYDGAGLKGILLYSSGEYEGAIKEFNKEIAGDPNAIGIALLNVRALIHLGKFQEAFDLNRAVIEQKRNDYEAIVLAASLSEKLGYLDFGLRACTVATRLRRNAADVWELKGKLLYKMGNYSESLSSFRQSLDLDGQVGAVWKEYGMVLVKSGWYREAIEAFGKAILLNGETPELRSRIEKCLKKLHENQDNTESIPFRGIISDTGQRDLGKQEPHSGTGKGPGEGQTGQDPDDREMILAIDKNNPSDLLNTGSYGQKY